MYELIAASTTRRNRAGAGWPWRSGNIEEIVVNMCWSGIAERRARPDEDRSKNKP